MTDRCVIIGAGHAAAQLCASLRTGGWEGGITLIGDEPDLPYHRPPLSKTQLDPDGDAGVQLIRPAAFYETNRIEFLSATRVSRIDREAKEVIAGGQCVPYDKLVLCVGSRHRLPPVEGIDSPKVFGLRTAGEAAAIREQLKNATSAVVIGAGFIGLEVAASLRKQGLHVTVLELAPRVLSRVTSSEVSAFFEALHRSHGVDLRCGVSASAVRETDNGVEVDVSDGRTISCDFVVTGAGAAANTDLAEAAGLKVDDGILVDAFNLSSDPDIYALGDCCKQMSAGYGRELRLESVQNAVDQAKTVAASLVGQPVPHTALPWFWSDMYDVKLQIAGVATGFDSVVIRGKPELGHSFSAWYFKGETLLAVDAVNDSIAYAVGSKLLKTGKQPDRAVISDLSIETKMILKLAKEPDHA